MFFDDIDLGPLKKRTLLKVPPPCPDTGWRPPSSFPNLSQATVIGFDTEGKEDDWEHGPGWARGKSDLVGFSLAAKDRLGNTGKWYFPIGHHVEAQDNLDRGNCLGFLKSVLETDVPKVGANLLLDTGMLTDYGIRVRGKLFDVQFAEALLNSDGLVNLDHLGEQYLGHGKTSNRLYEWCAAAYGGPATGGQRSNIWRAPPRLVGAYGEDDAMLPIEIYEKQAPLLHAQYLSDLFDMECGLIPLLVQMRIEGVTVDLKQAQALYDELTIDIARLYVELYNLVPINIESVNSGDDIARVFDHAGIPYPTTANGNPSFRKDWLKNQEHPVADKINEIREYEKIQSTFIRNYILEGNVNGKIHCQFHPLRNDDGGARTGRFASSDPNLQNIPVRSKLGKRVRRCFTYDTGHIAWEKNDYSQIEYRDLAHFACDKGDGSADRLREAYNLDPKTDYHKKTQSNVFELTGIEIERRPIKNMNFGLVYGMSEGKLIRQNGFSISQGKAVFKAYHEGNPYVRPTMEAAANEMQKLGYITTVLGRRTRFNYWEPLFRDYDKPRPPALPYDYAIRKYGSLIKRADEHKAINYRLQGSAAEHIKAGMYRCWKEGIFDVTGVPRLQVHDELDFSVRDDNPQSNEAFREMRVHLETACPIRVPVRVDFSRAASWGDIAD